MRVSVIGGGVAGLVTAKVLKQDGFDVTVFEKEPAVGGVWAESRAYPGLSTNNPRETYVFSDFPHFDSTDEFPSARDVREYLEAYVDHFGLRPHLRLATEVVSVARGTADSGQANPGFRVAARSIGAGAEPEVFDFDFVVVCNGVLSEPHMPRFDGADRFAGSIIHSSRTPGAQQLEGKRVIVIGAGKSALDCASFAGRAAASCTLVFRKPYWMLPRYFFGRYRVDEHVFTRLTELITFPAYHELSRTEKILRWIGRPLSPLLWILWNVQCRIVARESRIPKIMVPDAPIHAYIYHQGIGSGIYDSLRQGVVTARRAAIDSFAGQDTVRLDTGEEIAADIVICGTGWRQSVSFLDNGLQREIRPDGRFRLYRHILPPSEPRMGFIGYASSGNAPLTSEIAAHWLSQCFRGELALPGRAAMENSIDTVLKWTEKAFPEQREGHFIGAYIAHYTDWLVRDMGLRTRRAPSRVEEHLGPFRAERYRDIAQERRRARSAVSARIS